MIEPAVTRASAISGTVLVVAACSDTEALLSAPAVESAGLTVELATDADEAIAHIDRGERVDAVLLAPPLPDPVRVAQRFHSLNRDGAVIVLTGPDREAELRHALEIAPFLSGDVSVITTTVDADALAAELAGAVARTRERREAAQARRERRSTPPPLSASYLGTLLDSVPIGLVTLDQDGAVIGWNKRTGDMLEMPELDALGKPFADLFAAADR